MTALATSDLHDAAGELAVLRELEAWLFEKRETAHTLGNSHEAAGEMGAAAFWREEWRNYWRLHQRVQASIAAMEGR